MASITRASAREYRIAIRAYGSSAATARTYIHCRLTRSLSRGWRIRYSHHEAQQKSGDRWESSLTWTEDLTPELQIYIRQSVFFALAEADISPRVVPMSSKSKTKRRKRKPST